MSSTQSSSKDKDKDKDLPTTDEELRAKAPLAPGDPEAAYVSPDLSTPKSNADTLPPEIEEWNEQRDGEREQEVRDAIEHERGVVKERQETLDKETEQRGKAAEAERKAAAAKSEVVK